ALWIRLSPNREQNSVFVRSLSPRGVCRGRDRHVGGTDINMSVGQTYGAYSLSLLLISSSYLFFLSLLLISSSYLFFLSLLLISSSYLFFLSLLLISSSYLFFLSLLLISSSYLFFLSLLSFLFLIKIYGYRPTYWSIHGGP